MLGDLNWSGTFSQTIQNGQLQPASAPNLQLNESPTALLSSLVTPIANALAPESGLGILGPLEADLDQPLPLINESIADLTGLDTKLPQFPSLDSGSQNANNVVSFLQGLGITVNDTAAALKFTMLASSRDDFREKSRV